MTVQTVPVGELQTNCYLVWDDARRTAIIDPGDEPARIAEEIDAHALIPEAILLTHLHIDHFAAVPALSARWDIPVILPAGELPAVDDDLRSLMMWLPPEDRFTLHYSKTVSDGDRFAVGDLMFTVLHTPGHTAGSCCYLSDDTLFSGDTLFRGSAGRCDLPSGDPTALAQSLVRLSSIGRDLRVLPGHGDKTTLDRERRFNPFMK